MEFYSDQPGVQFYTSNFMPDPENNVNFLSNFDMLKLTKIFLQIYPKGKIQDATPLNANQPISGKGGAQYRKHAGFALETQKYPNSVNHVSVCIFCPKFDEKLSILNRKTFNSRLTSPVLLSFLVTYTDMNLSTDLASNNDIGVCLSFVIVT